MPKVEMKADCTQCAALCCVALSFERSEHFAIDKDSGVACPNLAENARCTIHGALTQKGFGGCVQYDCLGAGQRVTQELFAGQSWQQNNSLLRPMMEAFRAMRLVHELLELLGAAQKLPLPAPEVLKLEVFLQSLKPKAGWTRETLQNFENGSSAKDVKAFLATLRPYV